MDRRHSTIPTITEIEAKDDPRDQLNNLVTLLVYLLKSLDPELDPRTDEEIQDNCRTGLRHWIRAYERLFVTIAVDDIHFAIGTRNRIVHPESYSQPTTMRHVSKSVRYLLAALTCDILPTVAERDPNLAKVVLDKPCVSSSTDERVDASEEPDHVVSAEKTHPDAETLGPGQSHNPARPATRSSEQRRWSNPALVAVSVLGLTILLSMMPLRSRESDSATNTDAADDAVITNRLSDYSRDIENTLPLAGSKVLPERRGQNTSKECPTQNGIEPVAEEVPPSKSGGRFAGDEDQTVGAYTHPSTLR